MIGKGSVPPVAWRPERTTDVRTVEGGRGLRMAVVVAELGFGAAGAARHRGAEGRGGGGVVGGGAVGRVAGEGGRGGDGVPESVGGRREKAEGEA
jgi:hypothetical protein